MQKLQELLHLITFEQMKLVLMNHYFSIGITLALFVCILLILRVFLKYSFLSFKILISWLIASFIVLAYLTNADKDSLIIVLNSQSILLISSFVILFIFYIFGLIFKKPPKKKKKYGRNSWWVNILGFIVTIAFCCAFNIILYVASIIFYL